MDQIFHNLIARLRTGHESAGDTDAATQLLQHLHQPHRVSADGWDPTPLNVACRTMERNHAIRRMHVVLPCPTHPAGVFPVVEYA